MNVLLVFPKFPLSYWGFQYALPFIGRKAGMPPLGLITIASLFPAHWTVRLVDMNVDPLRADDIMWADVVFTSSMLVQKKSLYGVIQLCNKYDTPIVVGGPHPTSYRQEIEEECGGLVDHFFLGEAETLFADLVRDLQSGTAQRVYDTRGEKPDIRLAPIPRFDLLKINAYGSMAIQFSRGCPFDCEFCDITKIFGKIPRTKTPQQMLAECHALLMCGWRGPVFLVDDNFIGQMKRALEFLPHLAHWQKAHGFPFAFYTEASVNIGKSLELVDAMVNAGFSMVFLGIETPNAKVLRRIGKTQNTQRMIGSKEYNPDFLPDVIRTLQQKGLEVTAGFIYGMDGEPEDAAERQVAFIEETAIAVAMTGILEPLKGTDLYIRLAQAGRLVDQASGNNVSARLAYIPERDSETVLREYRMILNALYGKGLKSYFGRAYRLLTTLKVTDHTVRKIGMLELKALARSLFYQTFSAHGPAYLTFLAKILVKRPKMFVEAIRLAIMGYHFERYTQDILRIQPVH